MSESSWTAWLAQQSKLRSERDLVRTTTPMATECLDLAGNDYLGLSRHPRVIAAAQDAIAEHGTGSRASRLVTGTTSVHEALEHRLAERSGQAAALVFSTGFAANLGVVAALADADTLIMSDAHVHASLIDACRLSRGRVRVVPHNDVEAVEAALADHNGRALVLCESIYSVLGDAAPLLPLTEVVQRHDALLVVDEAHGIGVRGRAGGGLVGELGLGGHEHIVQTVTLSKALGSQGGAVLGSETIREHLVNTARSFIFDTGLAPAAAAAAHEALAVIAEEPVLAAALSTRSHRLAATLGLENPAGGVVSVPMDSPQAALEAQARCRAQGVQVGCFRPPSVPDGVSRLRITINASVGDDDWDRAADVIYSVVPTHGSAR